MRTSLRIAVLTILATGLVGCGVDAPIEPTAVQLATGGDRTAPNVVGCPGSSSTVLCQEAIDMGALTPDASLFEMNCGQEACEGKGVGLWTFSHIAVDSSNGFDAAVYTCPNSTLGSMLSSHACWECTGDCADPESLPTGAQFSSVVKDGPSGSDCRARKCPAGYHRYDPGFGMPSICVAYLPATPSVTATVHSGQFVKLSWSAIANADSVHVERRLDTQQDFDRWYTGATSPYIDGSTNVTGSPQSSAPSGHWAAYRVKAWSAFGSSYSAVFYYPYGGGGPE